MINTKPNMSSRQIFEELPVPDKIDTSNILIYIYKGVFIVIKLLLDIRLNLVKISEGKQIKTRFKEEKQENPVIKNTDVIK